MNPPHKNHPLLFNKYMTSALLKSACKVMQETPIATYDEFLQYDNLLRKVGREFEKYKYGDPPRGMPPRSPREIRCEIMRLYARFQKYTDSVYDDEERKRIFNNPLEWAEEIEDDDDDFMPPSNKGRRSVSSRGKGAASTKVKGAASSMHDDDDDFMCSSNMGKSSSSSKGKGGASSKGKGAASSKDDDDEDFLTVITASKSSKSRFFKIWL